MIGYTIRRFREILKVAGGLGEIQKSGAKKRDAMKIRARVEIGVQLGLTVVVVGMAVYGLASDRVEDEMKRILMTTLGVVIGYWLR